MAHYYREADKQGYRPLSEMVGHSYDVTFASSVDGPSSAQRTFKSLEMVSASGNTVCFRDQTGIALDHFQRLHHAQTDASTREHRSLITSLDRDVVCLYHLTILALHRDGQLVWRRLDSDPFRERLHDTRP